MKKKYFRKGWPVISIDTKKKELSGIVEGFNNKVQLTTRESYGFRTRKTIETASATTTTTE